jgi:hypothetical protein
MPNQKSNTVRPLPTIRRTSNGYEAVGLAIVEARPWRSWHLARVVAQRIADRPTEYMGAVRISSCPGVRELPAA